MAFTGLPRWWRITPSVQVPVVSFPVDWRDDGASPRPKIGMVPALSFWIALSVSDSQQYSSSDVDELRRQCDECHVPGKRPGLYAYPSGRWEIRLPAHLSEALPHSRLHKLPKEETDKNAWLAQVAADSDTWLFSVTFYLCSIYGWVADWCHFMTRQLQQAKSSSRLAKVTGDIGYKPIKDLKRKQEGKKAITKQAATVHFGKVAER
ncbi:hypothetical protein BC332_10484 [Capsicum chinense]|nr:hypothetical protein BC332_10484 [Capsicum chinense]